MRVVVTGGTGFIGKALVMALTERGDDVVVLSRGRVGQGNECGLGPRPTCCRGAGRVELARWTPEREGEWSSVVDGADAVVHLAGANVLDQAWTPERKETLRVGRICSTELLSKAVARASKKPRVLVSASAVGYYGIAAGDRVLTEESAAGTDFLAKLCLDWEAAAAAARDAGVRVAHPRIGLVLGKHGGLLEKMLPPFRAFLGGPVGTGAQYMSWIHVADVVRAIEHALDTDLTGAFNVTAPEPVTMATFARVLGETLGRPASLRVPAFAVKLALGARAEVVLTGQRALPRRLVGAGFAFLFPELRSALADLVAR